jgi:hypothetical protein
VYHPRGGSCEWRCRDISDPHPTQHGLGGQAREVRRGGLAQRTGLPDSRGRHSHSYTEPARRHGEGQAEAGSAAGRLDGVPKLEGNVVRGHGVWVALLGGVIGSQSEVRTRGVATSGRNSSWNTRSHVWRRCVSTMRNEPLLEVHTRERCRRSLKKQQRPPVLVVHATRGPTRLLSQGLIFNLPYLVMRPRRALLRAGAHRLPTAVALL